MPLERAAVPVARPRTHSVSAVLNRPPFLRNERSIRVASAGLVVLAVAGLFVTTPLVSTPADASTPGAAPITVTWAGDTSSASAYQPTRDTISAHYGDFDDLSVTVSQTTGLIDQAVRVTVSGFAGTIGATQSTNEVIADNAKNFVQAMQCWGPDPLAANFNETCQWGGRYVPSGNVVGTSVYRDNVRRVAEIDSDPFRPTTFDVPFRTVDPRPVAGTQGLIATTWHPTLETWGAAQAQNRFRRQAGRLMRPLDYQAWAAVRSIGEAATQKKTADPTVLAPYFADPAFSLPAYKGVSLTYRPWDHQLRQPIIVVQPKAMVSVAPEQGFTHQRTPLDTLGVDLPETACKF